MAGKSTTLANRFLDAVLGNAFYPSSLDTGVSSGTPPNLYVALFTSDPTASATGVECSGTGYARKAVVQNTTNWPAASGGSKSNGTAITFAVAGGSWGTLTHFAIFDALTGGNMLYFGPLTASVTLSSGQQFAFPAGALVVTEG